MHSDAARKSTPYWPVTRIPRMRTTLPRPSGRRQALPAACGWRSKEPTCSRPTLAISTRTALRPRSATKPRRSRSRPCSAAAKARPDELTKSATGHLMGAGGLTEAIACIKAIEAGVLPPTLHWPRPIRTAIWIMCRIRPARRKSPLRCPIRSASADKIPA